MELFNGAQNYRLKENFKTLLIGPVFIGDLPRFYCGRFGENLNIDGGLLKFIYSCNFLKLQGSYVEFTDSRWEASRGNVSLELLGGRLQFLLPSTRTLFYEHLPKLYELVFGETFDSGSDLSHFIESHPCLGFASHVFVKYNDPSNTTQQPLSVGNPRHKMFLTRRFIYLLRLFPKSPDDLVRMYKEEFGEDLPVKPRLLPAIFKNFLSEYFVVSASNMIYFATAPASAELRPEIPQLLVGPSSDVSSLMIDRLVYLKYQLQLESRYLQFMYYDVFGEPITDFATLERFIHAAFPSASGRLLDALEHAHVCQPNTDRSSTETIKQLLSNGPMKMNNLFDAWSSGSQIFARTFLDRGTFFDVCLEVPGVVIEGDAARLADCSQDYVHRQLRRLVDNRTQLAALPALFKKAYGYTIPDEYSVREYVLAGGSLRIDADQTVERTPEVSALDANAREAPVAGNAAASSQVDDRDAKQKRKVLKLLRKRAMRFDKIRGEYRESFGCDLALSIKLSAWLQTVAGLDVDWKNQIVSSGLYGAQARVVVLLMELKEINFERIPAEYKKKYGVDLVYKGLLKSWLCKIPGVIISPCQTCSYGRTIRGGSMLDSSEGKAELEHDIKPRTQQEQALDVIIANPGANISKFLELFKKQHGIALSYTGKLKTWLLDIPGVVVSKTDDLRVQPTDVATNAENNVRELLKHKQWVPVDNFAKTYRELFNVTASETWILARQREIDFLMLLNDKVRYEELSPKTCLQYVKHLANLCKGLTVQQVKSYFPATFGFTLPESMNKLVEQSFPTGWIEAGSATNLEIEILDDLKNLHASHRRALLYLMNSKRWIRLRDIPREIGIEPPKDISESTFRKSIPNVAVKNSRVKYQKLTSSLLLDCIEKIVLWVKLVRIPELPMLVEQIFGFTVGAGNVPLEDLKMRASIQISGDCLRAVPLQPISLEMSISARNRLVDHSNNQLNRLFRLVAEKPNIDLTELETAYQKEFVAPIINFGKSLKQYLDHHPEFLVTNGKVVVTVPLSEALNEPRNRLSTDAANNIMSAHPPAKESTEASKFPVVDINAYAPNIISNHSKIGSADSLLEESSKTASPDIAHQTNSKQPELELFLSLIGDREREIKPLCNDYENRFKIPISQEKLERLLLSAGYCCVDGRVHSGCQERLRYLLSALELDQVRVITEFKALFSRSPCYTGTLRSHLLRIGCKESPGKLFHFPIRRKPIDPASDAMIQRLLPVIGFKHRPIEVLQVLAEYNSRHDPPLTPESIRAELGKLNFIFLTKKKKSFLCCGIHRASVEAIEECIRDDVNKLSLSNLAQELPAFAGTELMYFGNLQTALKSVGFDVSNDLITQEKREAKPQEDTSEKNLSSFELIGIRSRLTALLSEGSKMTYNELEKKLSDAMGYSFRYPFLGCSNFASFLRVYLPNVGMVLEEDTVVLAGAIDTSGNTSSKSSPARSSDQQCFNVLDVLRVSGPLLYPSELQTKFVQLTGAILPIPDPDSYLAQLLRAMELTVRSDKLGNIRVSASPLCSEEELYESAEENASSIQESSF